MSITISIVPDKKEAPMVFPCLRQLINSRTYTKEKLGPLVVLFTSKETGVALSGVAASRIGKEEVWPAYNNPIWVPTGISINNT